MQHTAAMLWICGAACTLGLWLAADRVGGPAAEEAGGLRAGAPDWAPPPVLAPVRIETPNPPLPRPSPPPPALAFMLGPESAGSPYAYGYGARGPAPAAAPGAAAPASLRVAAPEAAGDLCDPAGACVLPLGLAASGENGALKPAVPLSAGAEAGDEIGPVAMDFGGGAFGPSGGGFGVAPGATPGGNSGGALAGDSGETAGQGGGAAPRSPGGGGLAFADAAPAGASSSAEVSLPASLTLLSAAMAALALVRRRRGPEAPRPGREG
ncbi:MAG: hypothetical protein VX463_03280 [Pseudomonadota bacterium]|nr:hypothetical protein [Pseudomonadota bacterium]